MRIAETGKKVGDRGDYYSTLQVPAWCVHDRDQGDELILGTAGEFVGLIMMGIVLMMYYGLYASMGNKPSTILRPERRIGTRAIREGVIVCVA